ncbi:BspA family leucine-rich repeat surface protein [uncultured Dokdonia sp.]|uniref:BspA family leucine-rich repeat surface protein n=1 Tax=uncultured Dokdonia sp. TaxID=575653 RepID=UPI00261E4B52|nr:BspA family leucine-rich repeat surface protein [uncultured Dokdonia sp.]
MKTVVKLTLVFLCMFAFQSCSEDEELVGEEQNTAPEINDQSFTVAENIADNEAIGIIEATDVDGDNLNFTIGGPDATLFEINNDGVLSLEDNQQLDFETATNHTLTITVSDGMTSAQATLSLTVIDVDDTSFITKWVTEFSNETITIITRANEYTYNYTIDWGDGTIQSGRTGDVAHVYETAGSHMISIRGDFPAIHMFPNDDGREQIRSVEQWGTIEWQTMEEAFIAAERLDINATDIPNLSQAESLRAMFAFVGELTVNSSINNWDVSTITDMGALFSISSFNGDISNWDVSSVTNMGNMFNASSFNQNISNWDVSNVINMSNMFNESDFNQDISGWNVNNVGNMTSMFRNSSFNQDISDWDVVNVTDMSGMFNNSIFNKDISGWNVSNVTTMLSMFRNSVFNQDISGWNVSNVTIMLSMFEDSSFDQDISDWNVSNVTDMVDMFEDSLFNQNISEWNVNNVTRMLNMFANSQFNQDISNWNVSEVVTMESMFENSPFNQDISSWNVVNVTECSNFSLDAPLAADNTPNFTNCDPN